MTAYSFPFNSMGRPSRAGSLRKRLRQKPWLTTANSRPWSACE